LAAGFFATGFFAASFFAGAAFAGAGFAGACFTGACFTEAFFAFAAAFAIVLCPSSAVRVGASKRACASSSDLLPGKLKAQFGTEGFLVDGVAENHHSERAPFSGTRTSIIAFGS
jgi:hypothetical protein